LAHVLSVSSSVLVGLILTVAPWTALWEAHQLFAPHTVLRALLMNPFLRGAVSGLGLVNLVLAAAEVHDLLRRD
jgi:hypothetical protein